MMENESSVKLSQVRSILDSAYEKEPKKGKQGGQSGYTVGLVTSLTQEDVSWIYRELRRVTEHVIDVKYVNPTQAKAKDLETALSECTFFIYISSGEKWKSFSSEQKKFTLSKLGKKKTLIVLLIDMEDSSEQEKKRIVRSQPGMEKYAAAVFLFGKMEKRFQFPGNASDGGSWRASSTTQGLNTGNVDQYSRPAHPRPQCRHFPDSKGFQDDMSQSPVKRKHIVGIFTRSGERDFMWLVKMLRENFQDYVGDVRCCFISNNEHQQFQEDMSQCTFGIVYHTKNRGRVNVTDVKESLYDKELEALCATLGRRNVLVLIDDLENSSDQEKARILHTQPSIQKWTCDLILISEEEKANNPELVTKLKSLTYVFGDEVAEPTSPNTRNDSPVQTAERLPHAPPAPSRSSVAIFSRSEENDYSWLSLQLSAESVDVRHYKIPAPTHPQEKAFKCKLVILYHSRKHGKIHLTDVKEALYHEDLETLSAKFGKRKVIVVIDDLEDGSDKVRGEILDRQPSVARFAGEIFLFSREEKKHLGKTGKHERRIAEKITRIKEMLRK